jgi:hypothetical protein
MVQMNGPGYLPSVEGGCGVLTFPALPFRLVGDGVLIRDFQNHDRAYAETRRLVAGRVQHDPYPSRAGISPSRRLPSFVLAPGCFRTGV